jgi:hypothetical protein
VDAGRVRAEKYRSESMIFESWFLPIAPGGQANAYPTYDLFGRQRFPTFTAKL